MTLPRRRKTRQTRTSARPAQPARTDAFQVVPPPREDSRENRGLLWAFIKEAFGIALPRRRFAPGHSSPFHFVAQAYFHPEQDLAAWACRSGLKTLACSIIAALEFLAYDNLQARVLSGSEAQAGFLYDYWTRWCRGILAGRVSELCRTHTTVAGGRMEIVPASQASVRGAKVHRLFEDELDEVDAEIDSAAVGMLASSDDIPARTVYASTWHRGDGLMGKLIDAAPANGVALHKWNIWESLENCPEDRHQGGAGCRECGLGPACVAKAREYHKKPELPCGIAAETMGLYRIDDAIKAFRKLDRGTWQAEYECRRPSTAGLVYADFDPMVHRRSKAPDHLTIYRSIDWGVGEFVCLWIGQDKSGSVWLLDTYQAEGGTLGRHAKHILAHPPGEAKATYCDPAGRSRNDQTGKSNIDAFRELGIPCTYTLSPQARDVHNGVRLIRAALAPACGDPTFHYVDTPGNRAFERAMQGYQNRRVNGVWIDEPQDPQEHEHIPDALRYFFVNRMRDAGVGVVKLRTS